VVAPAGNGRWQDYAGGYADMLLQRGDDIVREAAKPAKREAGTKAPGAAEPKAAKRRLSFNEKHALETLPKRIAELEARVRNLQAKLDDPNLYARDRDAFDAASTGLATAQSELAEAEEKWLTLEMLREEIEGA
jgi:ABC transport system ATP-binding/permease protein